MSKAYWPTPGGASSRRLAAAVSREKHLEAFAALVVSEPSLSDVEKFLAEMVDRRADDQLIAAARELRARLQGGK